MAVLLFVLVKFGVLGNERHVSRRRIFLAAMAMVIYTPLAYVTDKWVYTRQQKPARAEEGLMEARWLTVGPVQENTWIARPRTASKAILIDPGDEPDTHHGGARRARTPRSRRS